MSDPNPNPIINEDDVSGSVIQPLVDTHMKTLTSAVKHNDAQAAAATQTACAANPGVCFDRMQPQYNRKEPWN